MSYAVCVSSESELELVEVLVAGELKVDSGTGSAISVAICGLLTVKCGQKWL